MATAIFDKPFDLTATDANDSVFRHEDGREWTPDELCLVKEAFEAASTTARRLIEHIDRDLAVQRDTLRNLKSCVALLETSNRQSAAQG